jgi:hypothetical protein
MRAPPSPAGESAQTASVAVDFISDETTLQRALSKATEIVPSLMEAVRRELAPEYEKYSAELRFAEGNPYMGFFLSRLPLTNIDRFVVEFSVPIAGAPAGARVSAQKERMTIVASTISGLSSVSKHYLSLAPSRRPA